MLSFVVLASRTVADQSFNGGRHAGPGEMWLDRIVETFATWVEEELMIPLKEGSPEC